MKKTKIVRFIVSALLLLTIIAINGETAFAQNGVEVPTNGEIVLFDSSSSNSSGPQTPMPKDKGIKPKRKLPSTGEVIKYGSAIGGGLLLLLVGLIYLLKKSNRNKEKEQ